MNKPVSDSDMVAGFYFKAIFGWVEILSFIIIVIAFTYLVRRHRKLKSTL